jgi:hypothetical protein
MLTEIERRMSQAEKEALAVVWGPERFAIYVLGSHFTIVTDNRAVQLIFSNTNSKPPPRIERMALRMSAFNCTFVHRPGKSNIADYYSRSPSKNNTGITTFLEELRTENYINAVVASALPAALSLKEVGQATKDDVLLQQLKTWIQAYPQPKLPSILNEYKHVKDELSVTSNGIILRGSSIIIPSSLRQHVLDLAHGGHQGIVKTKTLIRSRVWFPGIDNSVEHLIKTCLACQANSDKMSFAPLMPTEMPPAPWHSVSGDLYGPMDDGCYWFVNYCEYTKWASVEKVKSTSQEAIEPVLVNLFDHFGVPVEYKTDNGSPFQSHRFAAFALEKGFKHRKVTPEWPRANGGVESFMKKLSKVVRIAKLTGQDKYTLIKDFLRRYRETPHSTTKVAPALLLLGRSRSSGIPQFVQPFNSLNLKEIHAYARRNHEVATARMKDEYDARMRVNQSNMDIGSLVLIKLKKSQKSTPIWDPDPYRVIGINGTQITASRHDRTTTRNSSFFKLFRYDDDEVTGSNTIPSSTSTANTTNPPATADFTPDFNIFDPVVELDAAHQSWTQHRAGRSQVSFNEDIVIINDQGNTPFVEPQPIATPAVEPSPTMPAATTKPSAKPGRPSKEQAAINEQNRIRFEQERHASNPPTRTSSRLANQISRGGKM